MTTMRAFQRGLARYEIKPQGIFPDFFNSALQKGVNQMIGGMSLARKLSALGFLLGASVSASAMDFAWETISGSRSSPPYGWNYQYDIGFFGGNIMIDLDIKLVGVDPGTALKDKWETGIEGMWSDFRFAVPILFNVDWVDSGQDQTVDVIAGDGHTNMLQWYTDSPAGWGYDYQDEVAAHEFGHMLSLYDEYAGGAIDPATGLIDTWGLMDTLDGSMLEYYYDPFLNWYQAKLDQGGQVPEPSMLLLFGTGLFGLALMRRRRT